MRVTPLTWLVLVVLIGMNAFIFWELSRPEETVLKVAFLDVGQGDAIFIEGPTGIQMLIDGGPDRSVLRQLPKEMGLFDRTIDVVVATHPDKDHIAGLVEVFDRYSVQTFIEPGVEGDSSYSEALDRSVAIENGVQPIQARRGMRLQLGGGAYADILYPDRDVSGLETNTASIVMRVVYGETEFMLTGDAPVLVEDWVLASGGMLESDVLKAGHHGSRTSTAPEWIQAVQPKYVVVSAGRDNSYGHPHQEVVDIVQKFGATLISTAERGSIRFESNGQVLEVK